jgi:hypothetical protein
MAPDPLQPIGVRRTPGPLGPVARVQPVRRRARTDDRDERPQDEDPRDGAQDRDPDDPGGGPHIDICA